MKLQQYLPFTVLKLVIDNIYKFHDIVATVLTVYGIETPAVSSTVGASSLIVATVLTVYGIETTQEWRKQQQDLRLLQQYLPFTVLKQI